MSKRHGFGDLLTEAKAPGDFPIGSSVGTYFNGHWYAGRVIGHGKRTTVRVAFTTGSTRAREVDVSTTRLDQVLDHGAVALKALRIRPMADGVVAPPQPARRGPKVTVMGLDGESNAKLAAKVSERTGLDVEAAGDWEPPAKARTAVQVVQDRASERDAAVAVARAGVALAGAERSTPGDDDQLSDTWYVKLHLARPASAEDLEQAIAAAVASLSASKRAVLDAEAYPDLCGDEDEVAS